jgi:hypothetical protein
LEDARRIRSTFFPAVFALREQEFQSMTNEESSFAMSVLSEKALEGQFSTASENISDRIVISRDKLSETLEGLLRRQGLSSRSSNHYQ